VTFELFCIHGLLSARTESGVGGNKPRQIDRVVCLVGIGITQEEHYRLCSAGLKITRFAYPLAGAAPEVIDNALGEIEEHHPDEVIWVQHVWSGA